MKIWKIAAQNSKNSDLIVNPKMSEFVLTDVTQQAKNWTYLENDDDCVYHITTKPNAKNITDKGFDMNHVQTIQGTAYQNYSKGKIFFTEKSGVSTWIEKIEQHLSYTYDNPPEIAVIKIPKLAFKEGELKSDDVGTKDTHSLAWYIDDIGVINDVANEYAKEKAKKTREPYHSLDMHDGVGEDDGW